MQGHRKYSRLPRFQAKPQGMVYAVSKSTLYSVSRNQSRSFATGFAALLPFPNQKKLYLYSSDFPQRIVLGANLPCGTRGELARKRLFEITSPVVVLALTLYPEILAQGFAQESRVFRASLLTVNFHPERFQRLFVDGRRAVCCRFSAGLPQAFNAA